MTQYRITVEDVAGQRLADWTFDASSDREAVSQGRASMPASVSGYQIWRDHGASNGPLVFAEWKLTLPQRPKE